VLEGGRGKHAAVLAPHGSLAEEAEQHAPNRNPQRGPSSTSPRHPVGDGDTLRVLRRLR
jgi:hypothetical protein